jgi:hypothetical protein
MGSGRATTGTRKSKCPSAIAPLRKGASDEEIVRWTTTPNVFDRREAGVSGSSQTAAILTNCCKRQ